jgi:DNA polymerase-3 subunit delta
MSKPVPTFYVFHGDDVFRIEEEVAKMRARMGDPATADLNTAAFDEHTATLADVMNAASALPFLADKRLVIVMGWLSWLARSGAGKTGKDTLDQLAAQLPGLPDWARLVFVEREVLKETHPVLRAAAADPRGYVQNFALPKDPTQWIMRRAEHYGAQIEPAAVQALASVVGNDLVAADNELFKLAAYTGGERPIAEADVAALTPYVPEQSVFDMVDALGQRDGQTAIRLLRRLLADGEALGLFAMIVRQFRLLLQAKEHLVTGQGHGPALVKALNVHRFVGEKLERQSRNFTLADLESIYRRLLDLDRRIKTGQIDPELALETLVAGLSA